MKTSAELRELLNRIDHKGYPAYKDTRGNWQFEGYTLSIDHVQGDPFAAPSKVSVHVPHRIIRPETQPGRLTGLLNSSVCQTSSSFYFQGERFRKKRSSLSQSLWTRGSRTNSM